MTIVCVDSPDVPVSDALDQLLNDIGIRSDGFRRSPSIIRTGTRSLRVPGPSGSSVWERVDRGARAPEGFQETAELVIREAIIRVHGVDIPCSNATMEQLTLLDASLFLVPPSHLQHVRDDRPRGLQMVSRAGRGSAASYMGGLNPPYDPSMILITYGALWQNRHLGICPTVLHEIGHVITGHGLSYAGFSPERARQLAAETVSRNDGPLEGLCNAYMYLLCYAAEAPEVRAYGSGRGIQHDRITRDGLRNCPAFSSLPIEWRQRFAERS